MVPSNNFDRRVSCAAPCRCCQRAGQRRGKVSLVAGVIMLAFVVLAGLIGNAGHVASEKLETQNAADAIAFSSTNWLARGMNSITAGNHLVGEATALAILHESFAGPELDLGIKRNTQENSVLDQLISTFKRTAPVGTPVPSPFGYTPPPVIQIDKKIVDFVTDRTSPQSGDRDMRAFATIYDSRMTLKRELAILLPTKSLANIGFLVPPPWGYATAIASYVVHTYATIQIVRIGEEWLLLEVLEQAALLTKPLKRTVIEQQLIPTLAEFTHAVAGYDNESNSLNSGIINRGVSRITEDLAQQHSVEATLSNKIDELRLPLEPEPAPGLAGGGPQLPAWGGDTEPAPDSGSSAIEQMKRQLASAERKMNRRLRELTDEQEQLEDWLEPIEERLDEDELSDEEKEELETEQTAIKQAQARQQERIDRIQKSIDELVAQRDQVTSQIGSVGGGNSQNPSVQSIPNQLNQQEESKCQFAAATYPYLDELRAPILGLMDRLLPKSKASKHFVKWSNRYALIKPWQYRSGYRASRSGSTVQWSKTKAPLRMLVMVDAFEQSQSRKGQEPWSLDSDDAKQKAESLFTQFAFVKRDYEPLFSKTVYPAPNDKGFACFSQAILYNANLSTSGRHGWDTLNWENEDDVPSWGDSPTKSPAMWPWELFDSRPSKIKVKLNWQSKLIPVTRSRLERASADVSDDIATQAELALEHFEAIVTH